MLVTRMSRALTLLAKNSAYWPPLPRARYSCAFERELCSQLSDRSAKEWISRDLSRNQFVMIAACVIAPYRPRR
jgi:hypothetical protein